MRMARLELHGFKSFPDRTVMELGPGISCVVGPNGCGKSNVLDALRWVIGEQSARNLRGGEMQDVIFAGSADRKPVGFAEVQLTMAADDEPFPGEYAHLPEIAVGRRLHRSGASEYFLNQTRCRRKDIVDLFLDTGVGNNLYSFIQQGEVDRVVNAAPSERRVLIDEAAGISRYKARREDAQGRLAATAAQLDRAADVADEMRRRLRVLERQGYAAARFRYLGELVRQDETLLSLARYAALAADRRALRERAQQRKQELQGVQRELRRREVDITTRREELQIAEHGLTSLRDEVAELDARQRELSSARAQRAERRKDLLQRIATRSEEVRELRSQIEALDVQCEVSAETVRKLSAEVAAADTSDRQTLDALRDQLVLQKRQLDEAEAAHRTQRDQLGRASLTTGRLSALQEQLAKDTEPPPEAGQPIDLDRLTAAHADTVLNLEVAQARLAEQSMGRDVARQAEAVARAGRNSLSSDLEEVQNRRRSLQEQQIALVGDRSTGRRALARDLGRFLSSEAQRLVESIAGVFDEREQGVRQLFRRAEALVARQERLQEQVEAMDRVAPDQLAARFPDADTLRAVLDVDAPWAEAMLGDLLDAPVVEADGLVQALDEGLEGTAILKGEGTDAWLDDVHTVDTLDDLLSSWVPGRVVVLGDAGIGIDSRGVVRAATSVASASRARAKKRDALASSLAENTNELRVLEAQLPPAGQSDALRDIAFSRQRAEQDVRQSLERLEADVLALPILRGDFRPGAELPKDLDEEGLAEQLNALATFDSEHERGEQDLAREVATAEESEGQLAERRGAMVMQRAEVEAAVAAADLQWSEAREAVAASADTARLAELKVQTAQTELARRDVAQEVWAARQRARSSQADDVAKELAAAEAQIRVLEHAVSDAVQLAEQRRQEVVDFEARVEAAAERWREASVSIATLRARLTAATQDVQRQQQARLDTRSRIDRISSDLQDQEATTTALAAEQSQTVRDLDVIAKQRAGRWDVLEKERERVRNLREGLRGAEEASRSGLERERSAAAAVAEADAKVQNARADIEVVRRRMEERYQVSLPGLLDQLERKQEVVLEPPEELTKPWEIGSKTVEAATRLCITSRDLEDKTAIEAAVQRLERNRGQLSRLGEVNLGALTEYGELRDRFQELDEQRADLDASLASIRKAIVRMNRLCRERFRDAFDRVNEAFSEGYPRLVGGGAARLELTDEEDLLESGVDIFVQPPGKRPQNLNLLSGGEKAMTAIALLLALFKVKPSPFCVLDEVDAPLDEANGVRFNDMIREMSSMSQFLVITHNRKTMECADTLYGVTMSRPGVSQLVSVKLPRNHEGSVRAEQ
jgi:chromosome segregation protein